MERIEDDEIAKDGTSIRVPIMLSDGADDADSNNNDAIRDAEYDARQRWIDRINSKSNSVKINDVADAEEAARIRMVNRMKRKI